MYEATDVACLVIAGMIQRQLTLQGENTPNGRLTTGRALATTTVGAIVISTRRDALLAGLPSRSAAMRTWPPSSIQGHRAPSRPVRCTCLRLWNSR